MGQSLSNAIDNSDAHESIHYVDLDLKNTSNCSNNFDKIDKELVREIDCIIDFTNSRGFAESSMFAMNNNIPYVSGSTGYSNDDFEKIKDLQSKNNVGVALCSNFSTGAILLAHLGKIASKYYNYAELIESHHEKKVDAPSGTAISIAKNTRGNDEAGINIHSLRLPGVIAKHELIFGSSGENLSITHNSSDRESFMPGVLLAVDYVIKNNDFVIGLEKILGL